VRRLGYPEFAETISETNIGGDGGNRTRVQKSSTASSTYLVQPIGFNPVDADARASSRRVTYV